jgi:hypothetical protein
MMVKKRSGLLSEKRVSRVPAGKVRGLNREGSKILQLELAGQPPLKEVSGILEG